MYTALTSLCALSKGSNLHLQNAETLTFTSAFRRFTTLLLRQAIPNGIESFVLYPTCLSHLSISFNQFPYGSSVSSAPI